MYLRPVSWFSVTSSEEENAPSVIYCSAYTVTGHNVCLQVAGGHTLTFTMPHIAVSRDVLKVEGGLVPKFVKISDYNPRVIVLRNPDMDDLYSNKPQEFYDQDRRYPDFQSFLGLKDITINKEGVLPAFWDATGINPYGWILVNNFKYLDTNPELKFHRCIYTKEDDISPHRYTGGNELSCRKLFWDIETYGTNENFSDSSNPGDYIFMISIVTLVGDTKMAYLLTWLNVNKDKMQSIDVPFKVMTYKDEKSMIEGFFEFWSSFRPDRTITYNGDYFDTPYLLARAEYHRIVLPNLGKIKTQNHHTEITFNSNFGPVTTAGIKTPCVEQLDLIHYFRRFLPGLNNYKLETVARNTIGQGKTGLEITDMLRIVASKDPNALAEVAYYSIVDSILLCKLWLDLKIESTIDNFSSQTHCSAEELLRMPDYKILRRLAYTVDAGTGNSYIRFDKPNYLFSAPMATYKNVTAYTYGDILHATMGEVLSANLNVFTFRLFERSENLPGPLMSKLCSSQVCNPLVATRFVDRIRNYTNNGITVIAINETCLYTTSNYDLANLGFRIFDKYSLMVALTASSKIVLKEPSEVMHYGNHALCQAKCQFMKDIVNHYLMNVFNNLTMEFGMLGDPMSRYICSAKARPLIYYTNENSLGAKLAKLLLDRGIKVTTWRKVNYIMTVNGLYLVLNNQDLINSPPLDKKYYQREMAKVVKTLTQLTIK